MPTTYDHVANNNWHGNVYLEKIINLYICILCILIYFNYAMTAYHIIISSKVENLLFYVCVVCFCCNKLINLLKVVLEQQ